VKGYAVHPIAFEQCKPWLLGRHYARRMCSISYAFGLYEDGKMKGVCTFGKPASPWLCVGVCGSEHSESVYELNRLCVSDETRNILSWFVAECLRQLPPMIVVSYADSAQGHIGYIYQATNWIYTGATKERTDIGTAEGKHSRHYETGENHPRQHRSSKHRYIYFIGSKTQRIKWRKALKYAQEPYPKGDNSRYAEAPIYSQAQLF